MNHQQKVAKKGINYFEFIDTDDENDFTNDSSIHVQFAVYLCNSNRLDKFEIWFNNMSKCNSSLLFDLMNNEDFCLCIVRLRFFQKKYELVFQLLKSGPFSAREDYVKLWEEAHYKQKEETLRQPLTPLQRFRIRKKFPPPVNICPYGRQIINPLFKQASVTLKRWFQEHTAYPYPSMQEKEMLAQQTGLTLYQVKTWFANTRRRKKVRQMQSSLECHKLLNKNHFLVDSEQLVKESSEALDLSIQNLEKKDQENVLIEQEAVMIRDAGLEPSVKKAVGNLREGNTHEQENETGQGVSKKSHRCCLYCPEFGEAPLNLTDHNTQQPEPNSKTGTFPNNLGSEISNNQNSTTEPNPSDGIKNADLFKFLLSQQLMLEENLQKNADTFKPYSSSEKMTKSMTRPQSEVKVQILDKTKYSPSHFRSFSTSEEQQVVTHSCDTVPISPPTPSPLVKSLTDVTQTLPESDCPNPTIYPLPVLTNPVDPSVAFRQDGSYLPNNENAFNPSLVLSQGIQNTKFRDNSDLYAKTTEQESYSAYLNLTPSCSSEYPLPPDAPCPATETLTFAVLSLPNNNIAPLSKPSSTSINNSHRLQIIQASNIHSVQMNNEGWIQMSRSCDPSPSTNCDSLSIGTSMSQMSQNLEDVTGTKELLILETEIAHTLLRLSRKRE